MIVYLSPCTSDQKHPDADIELSALDSRILEDQWILDVLLSESVLMLDDRVVVLVKSNADAFRAGLALGQP